MKYAPSGTAYTKVSIAVDNVYLHKYRNGGDKPDWFNVVAFEPPSSSTSTARKAVWWR